MSNQQQSSQQSLRCPRCGGRLFLESEFRGDRLLHFLECSVGCSRQWGLDGKPVNYHVGERRIRIIRELVPVG